MTAAPPDFALTPEDGPSFEAYHPERLSRIVIVCDHARNRIPRCLGDMGLHPAEMERHIAYDIGSEGVARHMADLLGAPALIHGFTRLALDPNRQLYDPDLIAVTSDGTDIPVNHNLSARHRAARIDALFRPYHLAIADAMAKVRLRGEVPIMISVHSLTPVMNKTPRPWPISLLWDKDDRIARPMMENLRAAGINVGDNEPYSRQKFRCYTTENHAEDFGLPNVLIEVRQDLVGTEEGQKAWAETLVRALPDPLP